MLLIMQCAVYIRFYVISSHVIVYIKSTYLYTLYKHIKCIVLNAFIYWVTQKVPSVFKQNYQTNFLSIFTKNFIEQCIHHFDVLPSAILGAMS